MAADPLKQLTNKKTSRKNENPKMIFFIIPPYLSSAYILNHLYR